MGPIKRQLFRMQKYQKRIRALCVGTLAGATVLLSGCASIVHGGARTLNVNTQPSGAKATIVKLGTMEVVHAATTPFTVQLSPRGGYFRGQSYAVRFELPGYRTEEVTIRSELSGWYFGNLVFGGLIGMLVVDPATGAMWNLSPDKIDRPMTDSQTAMLKSGDGFLVTLVSEISDSEKNRMVQVR